MTENEVFEGIHKDCGSLEICDYKNTGCSDCIIRQTLIKAEKAIEEIQQYRAIGTVESLKGLPAICDSLAESSMKAEKLIEELKAYRAIGTVEGYKRAVEVSKENYYLCAEYKARLKKFEAIGTIDEFKALKEKNEPKKVNEDDCCPICHTYGKDDNEVAGDYCPECGQKLDWQ